MSSPGPETAVTAASESAAAPALVPRPDEGESVSDLVMRAQNGDRSAEAILCARFLPAVRTFARRRHSNLDAVNEFTQEVLLRVIEALRSAAVRDPHALGGYVLGICRTLTNGSARQRRRREELWAQYSVDLLPLELPVEGQALLPVAKLEDCLSQLSRRARDVVRLGFVEMKSHAEIALTLDLSPANTRVLRHRTLATLRECMDRGISWESA